MKSCHSKRPVTALSITVLTATGCSCGQKSPTEHQVEQRLAVMPSGVSGREAAKILEGMGLTILIDDPEMIQLSGKRRTCFMFWDQLNVGLYLDQNGRLKHSYVGYDMNLP